MLETNLSIYRWDFKSYIQTEIIDTIIARHKEETVRIVKIYGDVDAYAVHLDGGLWIYAKKKSNPIIFISTPRPTSP
jgi:hypothetical protein